METNRATDVLFGGERPMDLDGMVDLVLGGPGRDRSDPRVSPLHGDVALLPPTYIQVSGAEMLLDDARRLADAGPPPSTWTWSRTSSTPSRWPRAALRSLTRPSRGSRRGCATASGWTRRDRG